MAIYAFQPETFRGVVVEKQGGELLGSLWGAFGGGAFGGVFGGVFGRRRSVSFVGRNVLFRLSGNVIRKAVRITIRKTPPPNFFLRFSIDLCNFYTPQPKTRDHAI